MEASEDAQLDADLSRLRRRAAPLKSEAATSPAAWRKWSITMEEIAGIIEAMVAAPAPDIADLARQFRAILWQIEINDSLLDHGDARRLKLFRRNLNLLAGSEPPLSGG